MPVRYNAGTEVVKAGAKRHEVAADIYAMGTEHDDQVLVFQIVARNVVLEPTLGLLYAVPNGAKLPYRGSGKRRFSPEAMRLKAEGLKPGVPDMVLPVSRKGFHGLYIELKHGKNKPNEDQVWWNEQLTAQGYLAVVCWGWCDVLRTIGDYLDYMFYEVQ